MREMYRWCIAYTSGTPRARHISVRQAICALARAFFSEKERVIVVWYLTCLIILTKLFNILLFYSVLSDIVPLHHPRLQMNHEASRGDLLHRAVFLQGGPGPL